MEDYGFFLTLQAIRRQLAALPNDLYLVRLIHHRTRQAFPGERLWSAQQLGTATTVRFLRGRNREGCVSRAGNGPDRIVDECQRWRGRRRAGFVWFRKSKLYRG